MRSAIAAVTFLGIFAGCSTDPYEAGPSEEEVTSRLATEFPAYVEIRSLEIRATENVGDKVQPLFKIRFEGEIQLREDTFAESSREGDAIIIAPVLEAGERRKIYGVSAAAYKAGNWQMEFQFDADPLADLGKPRALFSGGRTILRGSNEETSFRNQQAKELAEQTKAAETRSRAEASRLQGLLTEQSRMWSGESWDSRDHWPMSVRILTFESSTGRFTGEVEWPTLTSIHRIEGSLIGARVVFTEVAYIRQGSAGLGCTYDLTLQGDRRLVGSYGRCGSGNSGQTQLLAQ